MKEDGRIHRSYKDGRARFNGYLEDYAMVADGLVGLYEATFETRWLLEADALMDAVSELFWDGGKRAFYDTPTDHEELVTRPRDVYDNAAPSGTSVATEVLLKLALLLDRGDYRQRAEDVLEELAGGMEKVPAGFGRLLCALDFSASEPREVAIVGDPGSAGYQGPVGEGLLQLSAEQGRGGTRPRRRRGGRFDPTPRPAPGSRRQGHGLRLRAIRLPDSRPRTQRNSHDSSAARHAPATPPLVSTRLRQLVSTLGLRLRLSARARLRQAPCQRFDFLPSFVAERVIVQNR